LNKAELDYVGFKLNEKESMFNMFDKSQLEKEVYFKYTKGEQWEKRDLLHLIDNEIDFSQQLPSSIKMDYNMR
jgi:hypothetical protein